MYPGGAGSAQSRTQGDGGGTSARGIARYRPRYWLKDTRQVDQAVQLNGQAGRDFQQGARLV